MAAPQKIGRRPLSIEQRRALMRIHVLRRHARWTPARKAALCMALRGAVVSIDEAVEHCGLTRDEIAGWLKTFARDGVAGLHVYTRRAA